MAWSVLQRTGFGKTFHQPTSSQNSIGRASPTTRTCRASAGFQQIRPPRLVILVPRALEGPRGISHRDAPPDAPQPDVRTGGTSADNDDIFSTTRGVYGCAGTGLSISTTAGQTVARIPAEGRIPDGRTTFTGLKTGSISWKACARRCPCPVEHFRATTRSSKFYDIDDKMQIPGGTRRWSGRTYEKDRLPSPNGARSATRRPHHRSHCHKMHLGDAWEWADDPNYPETFASMAFRVGLDYII